MSLRIEISKAIEKTEELLNRISDLSGLDYKEGKEKRQELDADVEKFLKVAFEDTENRIKEYKGRVTAEILGREKSDKEKQEDYEAGVEYKQEYLEDLKDELELKKELESDKKSEEVKNEASSNIQDSNLSAGGDIVINNEANQDSDIEKFKGDKKQVFFIEQYSQFLDKNFKDSTIGGVALFNLLASFLSIWGSFNDILSVSFSSEIGITVGLSTGVLGASLIAALEFKQERSCSECKAKFSMNEYKDPEVIKKEKEDKFEYQVKRFLKCSNCGSTTEKEETYTEQKEEN